MEWNKGVLYGAGELPSKYALECALRNIFRQIGVNILLYDNRGFDSIAKCPLWV